MAADERLAATAASLSSQTRWEPVGEVPLRFHAGHPQGMVRIDGMWWITTVDLGARAGAVLVADREGSLVGRVSVGDGRRFHPGGMDHDGEALWIASSEYRPGSTALVQRLVPDGVSSPDAVFAVDDHVGAVVRLGSDGDLVGWTWGSRGFLRWRLDGRAVAVATNPGHFVDFQDGQWLGRDLVLCTGVGIVPTGDGPRPVGGIALLRGDDLSVAVEAPFPAYSPATGRPATYNPMWVETADDSMVVHLLPDDGHGVILSYATPLANMSGQ